MALMKALECGIDSRKPKLTRTMKRLALASEERGTNGSKRTKGGLHTNIDDDSDCNKIWLNHKLVPRPNYVTSYGILFYRDPQNNNRRVEDDSETATVIKPQCLEFEYLLGLIPQGNSWTVFKGLPEGDEKPHETAMREFEEETSLDFPYSKADWKHHCEIKAELYGVTSTKKLLQIFLIRAPPMLDVSKFEIDKVVKIDSGRFSGVPEIIEIKFLTKKQAVEGTCGTGKYKVAKIYKSQISILERADMILSQSEALSE